MKLFSFLKSLTFFNVPQSPDDTSESACHPCVLPKTNVNFGFFFLKYQIQWDPADTTSSDCAAQTVSNQMAS